MSGGDVSQAIQRCQHPPCGQHHVGYEPLADLKVPFVFASVANGVTVRKNAPYLRTEAERVGQDLEHDVSIA